MLVTSPVVWQVFPGFSSFTHALLNFVPAVVRQVPFTFAPVVTALA